MKIPLEYLNTKLGRESIFKKIIWNDSLHQAIIEYGAKIVKFATSKNPDLESTMFPHRNIYQHT
jgi:hypothetical protein